MQQQEQHQQQQSTSVVLIPSQLHTVYAVAEQKIIFPNFPEKQALGVGITLVVAGALSIMCNAIEIIVDSRSHRNMYWMYGDVGHGFWVGIICVIPGAFGIAASKFKTKRWICAFNVMCIIAASSSAAQFGVGLTGAIVGPYSPCYGWYDNCTVQNTAKAMEALLVVLALSEAVAAIWGSVICCRTRCCCSSCVTGGPGLIVAVMPTYIPLTYDSGNQQFAPTQGPAQGYTNNAYQPGCPGQPVFTTLPSAQFVPAADQPPPYIVNQQNVQMMNQPMMELGVQAQVDPPAAALQPGMPATAVTLLHAGKTQELAK